MSSVDSSIRRQRRAMVVSSDMPRWLEPNGSRGMMVGITSTPVCVCVGGEGVGEGRGG